jgi:hypothetical protein
MALAVPAVLEQHRRGDGVEGRLGDGDVDQARLVAAYEVVERLFAVKDASLVEALATPESQPRGDLVEPMKPRNRRQMLARGRY